MTRKKLSMESIKMAVRIFLDFLVEKNVELYLSVISIIASITAIVLLAINAEL